MSPFFLYTMYEYFSNYDITKCLLSCDVLLMLIRSHKKQVDFMIYLFFPFWSYAVLIINQFYYFRVSIDNKGNFYFSNERKLE
jgi:hypothetical protein